MSGRFYETPGCWTPWPTICPSAADNGRHPAAMAAGIHPLRKMQPRPWRYWETLSEVVHG